jgi:tetratricopeptide (TPR) repeat protein
VVTALDLRDEGRRHTGREVASHLPANTLLFVEGINRLVRAVAHPALRTAIVAVFSALLSAIVSVLIVGMPLDRGTTPYLFAGVFLLGMLVASLLAKRLSDRSAIGGSVRSEWRKLNRSVYVRSKSKWRRGASVTKDEAELVQTYGQLGSKLDEWLAGCERKDGGALQVMWLLDEEREQRRRGLEACVARAVGRKALVGVTGKDLDAAVAATERAMFALASSSMPVVAVELGESQDEVPWTKLLYTLERRAIDPKLNHRGSNAVLLVAGLPKQLEAVATSLDQLAEITAVSIDGGRPRSPYNLDAMSTLTDRVYNHGLPITDRKLYGRKEERVQLEDAWASEQTRVLSIVAMGGAGKSALVNDWLKDVGKAGFPGAEKVLIWSFYSQGTRENLVSADIFVNAALRWLGDGQAVTLSPAARGARLASLIKRHRFLLVLDGLEPLQHPPDADKVGGKLADNSIRALLESLAVPDWNGLCLVTTRVRVAELTPFEEGNARSIGAVERLDLGPLKADDAVGLLRGLVGPSSNERELRDAVEEMDRHALATTLLGSYIRAAHAGDLTARPQLRTLAGLDREGEHARRVMAADVRWLQANGHEDAIAILRFIGLFDRPAEPRALAALLADRELGRPANLKQVGDEAWNRCVKLLTELAFLSTKVSGPPGSLDAHPLVREHFRDELKTKRQSTWKRGNLVLYEHYASRAPHRPTTTASMQPLYAAVTHGCEAGLHREVFDKVLLARVWRDRRTNYSTRRLGMTGADIAALSNYFPSSDWSRLGHFDLPPAARILILTNAGVRLRQLGELADARESFTAVDDEIDILSAGSQDLEDAAYGAAQHAELQVIAGQLGGRGGRVDGALESAERAVKYADGGKDPYFSMHARSTLGEVHFMLGDLDRAGECFEEAREVERRRRPKPPFLYSQGLFRYVYYLIERGMEYQVIEEARSDTGWGTDGNDSSLLSGAIRLLVSGAVRRSLVERGDRAPTLLAEGEELLDAAYDEFKQAGYADYTVRGLVERARFFRVRGEAGDFEAARRDLTAATYEAQHGGMDLLEADVLLERAACYLVFWPQLTASEQEEARAEMPRVLEEAVGLVETLGYGRRHEMARNLQRDAKAAGLL